MKPVEDKAGTDTVEEEVVHSIEETLVTVDVTGTWQSTDGPVWVIRLEQQGPKVTGSVLRADIYGDLPSVELMRPTQNLTTVVVMTAFIIYRFVLMAFVFLLTTHLRSRVRFRSLPGQV
jgi:hypothetical protein